MIRLLEISAMLCSLFVQRGATVESRPLTFLRGSCRLLLAQAECLVARQSFLTLMREDGHWWNLEASVLGLARS